MWNQFFLENVHFAVNLFAALVFFGVSWLYYDAWKSDKNINGLLRAVGFVLLTLSFVIHAAFLEVALLGNSLVPESLHLWVQIIFRNLGYLFVLFSVGTEKLQPKPKVNAFVVPFAITSIVLLQVIPFFLALLITIFYFRRATYGLERHLKLVTLSFAFITFSEFFSLASLFRATDNVDIYNLVTALGPLWIIEHLLLLVGIFILGRWVFGYLLKQFQTQLFMIISSMVLVIFLITTVCFTALLLKNIEDETTKQLESDVRVLEYALVSKKEASVGDAQTIAQNQNVIDALVQKDRPKLAAIAEELLLSKNNSFLVIVDTNGQIVARGEDKEKVGGSLSDDVLIKRALVGQSASSAATKDGVLVPELSLRGASPIKSDQNIIGAVMVGTQVDNAFVDGIKKATGLEASLYSDNSLSATTLVGSDNKSRLVGVKEESKIIKEKVLRDAQSYSGSVNINNKPLFAAYLPLKNVDNNPIGMLFVARSQIGVLKAASRSIELTFILTSVMILVSIIPSYLVSRYIAKQL